jgi:hypothetical protein
MTDYYLKFDTEEEANLILYTDETPNYQNIDVLGVLYEGGEWDKEGNEIVAPTQLDGWHVNVRLVDGEYGEVLEPYGVYPTQPRRVFG